MTGTGRTEVQLLANSTNYQPVLTMPLVKVLSPSDIIKQKVTQRPGACSAYYWMCSSDASTAHSGSSSEG